MARGENVGKDQFFADTSWVDYNLGVNLPDEVMMEIKGLVRRFSGNKRKTVSQTWPVIMPIAVGARQTMRKVKNVMNVTIARKVYPKKFEYKLVKHKSVLVRKSGEIDDRLQRNKKRNLELAVKRLNGLVVRRGQVFSFWEIVGKPNQRLGYENGLLLADGRMTEGVGGGLCQLSNLLFWMFVHCDVEIIERHHHGYDVFPDSGRVLPFGSGATVMFNYVDLKIKNIGDGDLQLELWVDDKFLQGRIWGSNPRKRHFRIKEMYHTFVKHQEKNFRYSQLWREEMIDGQVVGKELVAKNFAPVMYNLGGQAEAINLDDN